MKKQVVIVIGGPTASGKTDLAIRLAQALHTEIINADSRQVYKELTIGTAKPDAIQLATVKHHMVDCASFAQPMNAGAYAQMAEPILNTLLQDRGIAVVTGGTGLYIQALLQGIDPLPETPAEVRNTVDALFRSEGLQGIQKELLRRSPNAGDFVALDNPARVRRALELLMSGPKDLNELWTGTKKQQTFEVLGFYLDMPRQQLYERIDLRCDNMIQAGLEGEVRNLIHYRENRALQTVGYSEFLTYFDGNYSLQECIEKIKQHTRNYAKRQITWFKNKTTFQAISPDKALHTIFEALKPYGYSHNQ